MSTDIRATTRIPQDIMDWLKATAKERNRSANGQLIEFLRQVKNQESKNDKNQHA